MSKQEKRELEALLKYLQDKIDPVYADETQAAIDDFLYEY